MRKLISFPMITLDGYSEGPDGELDWSNVDEEFYDFSKSQNASVDTLLFGRNTYEHMAAYWPTTTVNDPGVTEFMNSVRKVVVSNSLDKADWNNSTLIKGDLAEAVTALKKEPGREIALFGAVKLTASLLELGLIDELRVMVNPVLLGGGVSLFSTLSRRVQLQLWQTRAFKSGNVLLTYRLA